MPLQIAFLTLLFIFLALSNSYRSLVSIKTVKIADLKPRHRLERLKWSERQRKMGRYRPEKYDYITIDCDYNVMDGHHRLDRLRKSLGRKDKIKVRQLGIHYQTYAILIVFSFLFVVTMVLVWFR